MKIVPAPLNYSVDECVNLLNRLGKYFNTFQIDIQDGKYITNKTITLEEYLVAFKKADKNIIEPSTFDFHLQTLSYEKEIEMLSKIKNSLKIGFILVHYSLNPNMNRLRKDYPDFSFGLVLNPEDTVSDLTTNYELSTMNSVQIMSIHPGPQGSPFIPETLNKIDQLRAHNYRNKILLDGAINQETIPQILAKKNKPDCLCIGSYLTKAKNLQENTENLNNLINSL